MWAAFPPLNLWPIAWFAPIGLLRLIDEPDLIGRRPYRTIWVAGFVHWALVFHFLPLPHWAGYFGWVALSFYLAFYFPAFVVLTRLARHRLGMPLALAAPVVWTALELVRGYLFTGISMALLGHTQVAWLPVIQIADLVGAYGVSFAIMFVAACLTRVLPLDQRRWSLLPLVPGVLLMAGILAYGVLRLNEPIAEDVELDSRPLRVALIQGSLDTVFGEDMERYRQNFRDYLDLTDRAVKDRDDLDLIVWPESMFTSGDAELVYEEGQEIPVPRVLADKVHNPEFTEKVQEGAAAFRTKLVDVAQWVNRSDDSRRRTHLLLGVETLQFRDADVERYNTAMLVHPDGLIGGRYYKMHRVVFGEYIPFGDVFPWVYHLSPMDQPLTAGDAPAAFEVDGWRLAPSICFESTVPHFIQRQTERLSNEGAPPDVLVNITNDGWFWGSACLDLHLTCTVFRSVELRRPHLVAANTGFSAHIDGNGRVVAKGPRRDTGVVYAEVRRDGRHSLYRQLGDWPARTCTILALGWLVIALARRRRSQGGSAETDPANSAKPARSV
jgi:apolipoprotein N-acyltransferase